MAKYLMSYEINIFSINAQTAIILPNFRAKLSLKIKYVVIIFSEFLLYVLSHMCHASSVFWGLILADTINLLSWFILDLTSMLTTSNCQIRSFSFTRIWLVSFEALCTSYNNMQLSYLLSLVSYLFPCLSFDFFCNFFTAQSYTLNQVVTYQLEKQGDSTISQRLNPNCPELWSCKPLHTNN